MTPKCIRKSKHNTHKTPKVVLKTRINAKVEEEDVEITAVNINLLQQIGPQKKLFRIYFIEKRATEGKQSTAMITDMIF